MTMTVVAVLLGALLAIALFAALIVVLVLGADRLVRAIQQILTSILGGRVYNSGQGRTSGGSREGQHGPDQLAQGASKTK